MAKVIEQKSPAGGGRLLLWSGVALVALIFLGTVVYLQYEEERYYAAPDSVWPAATR
ncbi:MAG: hypothetical protein ABR497_05915 [Kiritimatiellia bacterium]|nr:hypothetical protein [Lentisphaerota bacterium]